MPRTYMGHSGYIGADTAWEELRPWWRPGAAEWLAEFLTPESRVFEWGSGASTLWLARRSMDLVSLEMDSSWVRVVEERLLREGLNEGVEIVYVLSQSSQMEQWRIYGDHILHLPDGHFDAICIDGRNRARCLDNARRKVRVGGVVLLDNSERQEYAQGVALYDGWEGYDWGDEGWMTTVWIRPEGADVELRRLPNADA